MDRDLWILQQLKKWRCPRLGTHIKKFTDGETNNHIDRTLIDKRSASSVPDVKLCRVANSNSEHFLVKGKYKCKIAYRKLEINGNPKKFNIKRLTVV